MIEKIINYFSTATIVVFVLYFLGLLVTQQPFSSYLYCLCFPLFGFACWGFLWLVWQVFNHRKKQIHRNPNAATRMIKTTTLTTPVKKQAISADTIIKGDIDKEENTIHHGTDLINNRDFVQVDAGREVNTPRITLTYSIETSASRFIKDAQKYHKLEGKFVESVAFMQYWPTFQSFTEKQKKWYFYWRSEIRRGRYIKTDLSYIFVYIYELLCLVEISDPVKAATQIKTIWREYRPLYKELDRYLPDWGGDLMVAKVGIAQGTAWWWELVTKDGFTPPTIVINAIIQKAVDAGKLDDLPYTIWTMLNLYHPQNKFYQRYNQNGVIDREYLKAIYAVNEYLLSTKAHKGLLEKYVPPKLYPQTKQAFTSAIVPDSYPKQISFGEAHNYASSSRLGNLLAAITKYTENILRKQNHFAARLSGFELEEKLQQVLDATFTRPEEKKIVEPVRITLDTKRVEALKQESELVSNLLEPEVVKTLYSDIAQVRTLWEKLDIRARWLLLAIYERKVRDASLVTADVIGSQISPFVLIDRINNISLPLLGDRIISMENHKQIMIADDFVDEMELIAKENPLESISLSSATPPTEEAEDPWERFLLQLSANESELLSLLVSAGSLEEDKIDEFARLRGQMGNLLIDSLNEKAIEQLGRTPFYPEDNKWFIEEEDLKVLREVAKAKGA